MDLNQAVQEVAQEMEREILHTLSQLEDHHDSYDQLWIQELICCHTNNTTVPDIEGGIIINITIIDNLVTKLLNVDTRILTKAKIIKEYIEKVWQQNGENTNLLNQNIVEE